MTNIKKSPILIFIVSCLFLLLSSSGFYSIYVTKSIEKDGEKINKLGILRGSLQKLLVLEMAQVPRNDFMDSIDRTIADFQNAEEGEHEDISESMEILSQSWESLKETIYGFRGNPSGENRQALLQASDEIWEKANQMVFISQWEAERKIKNYNISYFIFFINLGLVLCVIVLLKKYVQDILEYQVNYDALTDIFNRCYYNQYLQREIERAERYASDFSLVMLDIDHFKKVNDTYGHDVGDRVLQELALVIKSSVRKNDVFARLGGEEFSIIVPETNIKNALILSEKIRKEIEEHPFDKAGHITISLGVTQYVRGDNSNKIYKRADTALYMAKNNGRNRIEYVLGNDKIEDLNTIKDDFVS